jgi:hypothetical protein
MGGRPKKRLILLFSVLCLNLHLQTIRIRLKRCWTNV